MIIFRLNEKAQGSLLLLPALLLAIGTVLALQVPAEGSRSWGQFLLGGLSSMGCFLLAGSAIKKIKGTAVVDHAPTLLKELEKLGGTITLASACLVTGQGPEATHKILEILSTQGKVKIVKTPRGSTLYTSPEKKETSS